MTRYFLSATLFLFSVFGCAASAATPPQAASNASTIRRVMVLGKGPDVELEITATTRVTPQAQLLSRPDRLVIDFPGAVPGPQLHPLVLDRGAVSAVRVGLFGSNPPITRVVVDLKSPQPYQIFPSANTVLVKIGSPNSAGAGATATTSAGENPSVANTAASTSGMSVVVNSRVPVGRVATATPTTVPPMAVAPATAGAPAAGISSGGEGTLIGTVVSGNPQVRPLVSLSVQQPSRPPQEFKGVSFQKGLLRVKVQNATLAQVLFDIQRLTGAEISVPAGAAQEQVVSDLGPAAPKEVLASLLNGSHYNFIILGSEGKDALGRVILTPKSGGTEETISPPSQDPALSTAQPVPDADSQPEAVMPVPDMPPEQTVPPQAEAQPN